MVISATTIILIMAANTAFADFPRCEEVLTAATSVATGYIVPTNLQDALLMVRTGARDAVIVYDPSFSNEVKGRLATLRATAISHNLNVAIDPVLAVGAVIREAREAAEANRARNKGGSLHGQSGGAALFKEWAERAVAENATDRFGSDRSETKPFPTRLRDAIVRV